MATRASKFPPCNSKGSACKADLAGQGFTGLPNRTKSLASAGTFSGLWSLSVWEIPKQPTEKDSSTALEGNKSIFSVSGTLVSQ